MYFASFDKLCNVRFLRGPYPPGGWLLHPCCQELRS